MPKLEELIIDFIGKWHYDVLNGKFKPSLKSKNLFQIINH